jgi:hypothetical protein
MTNPTLELLRQLSTHLVREWMARDTYGCELQAQVKTLDCAFKARHRHNETLIWEVNDLLDAYLLQVDYASEHRFCLGLQMGLELGGLQAMPGEDIWQYAQFS